MAATLERIVPKKSDKPNTEQSVKIHGDVVQMARTVVSVRGGSMSDLISNLARPKLLETLEEIQKRGELFPKPKK